MRILGVDKGQEIVIKYKTNKEYVCSGRNHLINITILLNETYNKVDMYIKIIIISI